MENEAVGIEALWQRIIAAQSGRWFLLKWMIVLGCAHSLGLGLSVARNTMFPMTTMQVLVWIITVSVIISGGAQGWLIFGWHWRSLMWTLIRLPPVFISLTGSRRVLEFINLATLVVELLLLCRIRRRPMWWIAPFAISMGVSISAGMWIYHANDAINSLALNLGVPAWFRRGYFISNSAFWTFHLALTGATLAWLMPPVAVKPEEALYHLPK